MRAGEINVYTLAAGEIFKVVADEDGAGEYWFTGRGHQDVRGGAIAADSETVLGPYIDRAEFRVECTAGNLTTDRVRHTSPSPVAMADYIVPEPSVGVAVEDATDNATAITQLNALLAQLREIGIIAENPE